jgi:hypothetical protein
MNIKPQSVILSCFISNLLAVAVVAQSTFRFENVNSAAGIDAPVFDAEGARLAGPNYAAELWGGVTSNSLSPTVSFFSGQRVILPFETGLAAGYFTTTSSMAVWAVSGGGFAWVQVRAWDARLGATYEEVLALGIGGYGESAQLNIRGGNPLGVPPTVSAALTGLQSFSLLPVVPEPSTWALLALGGAGGWFVAGRKQKGFR